jgi:hypothetical protein
MTEKRCERGPLLSSFKFCLVLGIRMDTERERGWMDGWMDGWMEGWRDGGMEGWRDGGMEG